MSTEPKNYIFNISSDCFRIANDGMGEGFWSKKGRTDYHFHADHDKKKLYIIGRPTSENKDWLDNLDFRTTKTIKAMFSQSEEDPNKPIQWFDDRKDIKVHTGFLRQYQAVAEEFLALAEKYSDYDIEIWGFSLGASWTQILLEVAVYLIYIRGKWAGRKVQGIFYACGNPWRKLPKELRKLVKQCSTFVINFWDPVTWMRLIGFNRYGKRVQIGRPWRFFPIQHHPTQMIKALDERTRKLEKKAAKKAEGE